MDPAVLDRLYSLAPEEFTGVRDALVKELTRAGDRTGASEVKALRKPTVAAWALNQVARTHGAEVRELLVLGETVRRAQEAGDAGALREASRDEQGVVVRLTRLATEAMSQAGRPASDTARAKLLQTLRSAVRDATVADALRQGCLSSDAAYAGFPDGLDVAAPASREDRPHREPPSSGGMPARAVQAARKELDRLESEVRRGARRARERSESATRARVAAKARPGTPRRRWPGCGCRRARRLGA